MSITPSTRPATRVILLVCCAGAFCAGLSLWSFSGKSSTQPPRGTLFNQGATPSSTQPASGHSVSNITLPALETREPAVTVNGVNGRESPDDAWAGFPLGTRDDFDFVATVCCAPEHIEPHRLWRLATLNPRDTHIAPHTRQGLTDILKQAADRMRPLAENRNALRVKELENARQRGAGSAIVTQNGRPVIPPDFAAGGSIMTTNLGTGEGMIVPMTELPASSAASREIESLGKQLGSDIVDWFSAIGTLTTAEQAALHNALQTYPGPKKG